MEIWRFEKRIALSEKKPPLAYSKMCRRWGNLSDLVHGLAISPLKPWLLYSEYVNNILFQNDFPLFSVVGLFLLVIYTAIGIASLPCDFIRGTNQIINSISQLESQMKETEGRLSYLR